MSRDRTEPCTEQVVQMTHTNLARVLCGTAAVPLLRVATVDSVCETCVCASGLCMRAAFERAASERAAFERAALNAAAVAPAAYEPSAYEPSAFEPAAFEKAASEQAAFKEAAPVRCSCMFRDSSIGRPSRKSLRPA